MFRKTVSVVLTVSFIATASSGILMLMNNTILFQLKMHPVHNIFGPLMILSGILHFLLNFRAFRSYYKHMALIALSAALVLMMGLFYAAGLNRSIDPKFIQIIASLESTLHAMKHDREDRSD